MADDVNSILRELIDNIVQGPVWDASGQKRQWVTVYFHTPSGFRGQVDMPLSDWTNEEVRNQKLFQAIAGLEGPFWEQPAEERKKGK